MNLTAVVFFLLDALEYFSFLGEYGLPQEIAAWAGSLGLKICISVRTDGIITATFNVVDLGSYSSPNCSIYFSSIISWC